MKTYSELKSLIEQRGVHPEFGDAGEGWGIEQNPHELATFLVRMQELGVQSCLEIGTGYKGGLSRFLAQDMGWRVTTVDIVDYGHRFNGVQYIVDSNAKFNRKFDLVFIDGDHAYDSVCRDHYSYCDNASKVIAYHDIAGFRNCEGVKEFWDEIDFDRVNEEMSENPVINSVIVYNEKGSGIGWIEL